MTAMRCVRCGHFWSIATLHPETFKAIGRWCPNCIAAVFPLMGGAS